MAANVTVGAVFGRLGGEGIDAKALSRDLGAFPPVSTSGVLKLDIGSMQVARDTVAYARKLLKNSAFQSGVTSVGAKTISSSITPKLEGIGGQYHTQIQESGFDMNQYMAGINASIQSAYNMINKIY